MISRSNFTKSQLKALGFAMATFTIAACSPLDIANLVSESDGFTVEHDIAYGNDARQKLDIYRATDSDPASPALLFFYGGRWQFGEKADYEFFASALASRGITTIVADYRLYPQVRWQAFLQDADAALAKSAELIPDRQLVTAGHSAGGYLAAMAALREDALATNGIDRCRLAGWIGLATPLDFLPLVDPDIIDTFGPGEAGPETQPVTYASQGDPPALLIHGLDDRTVLPLNSERMAKALEEIGTQAEVKLYEDLGHVGVIASFARPTRSLSPALNDVLAFLNNLPERSDC